MDTQKYFDMIYSEKLEEPVCYVPVVNGIPRNASMYDDHKFIKSSSNIIDLIEIGDYVNGNPVCLIKEDEHNRKWIYTDSNYKCGYLEEDIETILTKEQFEKMMYKIGDE